MVLLVKMDLAALTLAGLGKHDSKLYQYNAVDSRAHETKFPGV